MNQIPDISVCIATYKRPERLLLVLQDLAAQTLPPGQVVIVDNDAAGSGRVAIDAMQAAAPPFSMHYEIQPERNIALTRNRTVAGAHGEWLAFIDDDERAPGDWLEKLIDAAAALQADGVLAPVLPVLPDDAPDWIRRGGFYDFPRLPTGSEIPPNQLRFGNLILRASAARSVPGPFDIRYGLTTGEDADMLLRIAERGARLRWCDEAVIHEPIEARRMSLKWLMQRVYSGGQEYARKALQGRYGTMTPLHRLKLLVDTLAKLVLSLLLVPLTLPLGRHRAAHWLLRYQANLGKLSAFAGQRYNEYESASSSG